MFLDNIGFVANMVSLVLYFMFVIHFDISGSATTTTNYLGTAFLLTIVGGFISDAYMNRLNTTLLFGVTELLVNIVPTLQVYFGSSHGNLLMHIMLSFAGIYVVDYSVPL